MTRPEIRLEGSSDQDQNAKNVIPRPTSHLAVVCFGIIWFHIWFLASCQAPHRAIKKKQPGMEPNIWSQFRQFRQRLVIGSVTRQTDHQPGTDTPARVFSFDYFLLPAVRLKLLSKQNEGHDKYGLDNIVMSSVDTGTQGYM